MKFTNQKFIAILFIIAGAYIVSVAGSGCAQIGAPTGGPRDTIPPVLISSIPKDSALNFKGNKIVFTFDEYMQLLNAQQNLLVNPTPKITPNIDYKLKTVTVKIRDTLEPNTTYRFDFGNSIADNNEGNPYKHFAFIFSTGSYIDSLQLRGQVTLAETGKKDSTLLVFLYKNLDDSAVYKQKPRYTTRLDSAGKFVFHNLPGGTYHIYALQDQSGQRTYTRNDELFAFADSAVTVSDSIKSIDLYAYTEEKPLPKTKVTTAAPEKKLKYTTTSLNGNLQSILAPLIITFNNKLKNFDSTKVILTDSLLTTFHPSINIDTTGKIITVQNNWDENRDYRLIISKDFATDSIGTALLKTDTVKFKTKKESDYGTIIINFKNRDKYKNPVLQFVSDNNVAGAYPITSNKLTIKLFNPGNYDIRILEDANNNGVWDAGSYHLKKQPERVYSLPKKLDVRANWDNEKDIVL